MHKDILNITKYLYTIRTNKKLNYNIIGKYRNQYIYNIYDIKKRIKKLIRLNSFLKSNNANSIYFQTGIKGSNVTYKYDNIKSYDMMYVNILRSPRKIKNKSINKLNYIITNNDRVVNNTKHTYNVTMNNLNSKSRKFITKVLKTSKNDSIKQFREKSI